MTLPWSSGGGCGKRMSPARPMEKSVKCQITVCYVFLFPEPLPGARCPLDLGVVDSSSPLSLQLLQCPPSEKPSWASRPKGLPPAAPSSPARHPFFSQHALLSESPSQFIHVLVCKWPLLPNTSAPQCPARHLARSRCLPSSTQ